MRHKRQQGVALVITLILLAVITFTAITFLVVSRSEKGAVSTSTDQTIALLAADTGLERAQAEILSRILSSSNRFRYDLKVTTNYYNPAGFVPVNGNNLTNVSYVYADGSPLNNSDDINQNVANLFYNPRPPVYVVTNRSLNSASDFRFYLDLNRNDRFDASGLQPVVGQNGNYVDTNGVDTGVSSLTQPPPANTRSNFVVGDPEWIGTLERPDEPHGPDNRFVARYATVVVPSGKTIDLNRVHNQARKDPTAVSYRRNMGAGTWEMNLAAFLVDLNTNVWAPADPLDRTRYYYDPLSGNPLDIAGLAFSDADQILAYRYDPKVLYSASPWLGLRSYTEVLGAISQTPFETDLIDAFGAGPRFLTNIWPALIDNDLGKSGVAGWPGDDNLERFFSPSDLFNPAKVGPGFVSRLRDVAITNNSTYNRYTFYRLLGQLGTDGGLERSDKININYDNRNRYLNGVRDALGTASATNFAPWRPLDFFVEAGDAMLKSYYGGRGGRFAQISITNIPVFDTVRTQMVYTPSVHRLLQVAANIHDASTNDVTRRLKGPAEVYAPSVFRPLFDYRSDTNGVVGVYITGWEEVPSVTGTNDPIFNQLVDLEDPAVSQAVAAGGSINRNANIYGVPWVVGARKGLPNFNELSMQSIFEITRKLRIDKPRGLTNQLFFVGVSNAVAVETWNSYVDAFPDGVEMAVKSSAAFGLAASNQFPGQVRGDVSLSRVDSFRYTNFSQAWPGRGAPNNPNKFAFQVPVYTNFVSFTNSILTDKGTLETNLNLGWQESSSTAGIGLPVPVIRLYTTNRLQFYMLVTDAASRKRVIDYVHLRFVTERDITRELQQEGLDVDRRMWDTNRVAGSGNMPRGAFNQILASLGSPTVPDFVWDDYGYRPGTQTKEQAIANFQAFYYGRNTTYRGYRGVYNPTNTAMQVPFSPSRRLEQYLSLQANDPLVHYMVGDLENLQQGDGVRQLSLRAPVPRLEDRNLRKLNDRYEPWGGNPSSGAQGGSSGGKNYNLALKDPGVRFSDDWAFPTNRFANVGWLGRVHRGTPWQTIYMKSEKVESQSRDKGGGRSEWRNWTGNRSREDSNLTLPSQDWKLFDLFTAAFNDNATAGQLSVNQSGLAAWSAVLAGVIALTNTAPGVYEPVVIPPAGVDITAAAVSRIVDGINRERIRRDSRGDYLHAKGVYQYLGEVFATPELSVKSPFLDTSSAAALKLTDAAYERIPQQIAGLLRGDEQPRFEIYSYGQALKPAERSLVTSGSFFGLCTNYQIMAEAATRTVVRIEGAPDNPRVVVESFNVLPPD